MSLRNPPFRLLRQLVTVYVIGFGFGFIAVDSALEAAQNEAFQDVHEKFARLTAASLLDDVSEAQGQLSVDAWMAEMQAQEPSLAFVRVRTEGGTVIAGDAEQARAFATVDDRTGAISAEVGLRPAEATGSIVPRMVLVSVFFAGLMALLRWTKTVRARFQALADLTRHPAHGDLPVFDGNDEFGWLGRRIVAGMDVHEPAANDSGAHEHIRRVA